MPFLPEMPDISDGTSYIPASSPAAASSPPNPNLSSRDNLYEEEQNITNHAKLLSLQSEGDFEMISNVNYLSEIEKMKLFYNKLFPFRYIFQWISQSPAPTQSFTNREIAYELPGGIYKRYNSYRTLEEFKRDVVLLTPNRFEIGAVYPVAPKDRKLVSKAVMKPIEKELVFDIDLTDYDDVRTCCSGTNICEKCWGFITVAQQIIENALKEDFGFLNIFWVYSGRRGIHCWVCDKRARVLTEYQRKCIVDYMEIFKGKNSGVNGKKISLKRPFHPLISRSFEILKRNFKKMILIQQDPWRDDNEAEKLLNILPDQILNLKLREKWNLKKNSSSLEKWNDIDELAKSGVSKNLNTLQLIEAKKDVIFEYMYPRLDVEVSRQLIHLLKSPFCIHPGTGRVCVPIDPEVDFDPFSVPTLDELLEELDKWTIEKSKDKSESTQRIHDYEKTSLKPYVDYFGKFVSGLNKTEMKMKRERDDTFDF